MFSTKNKNSLNFNNKVDFFINISSFFILVKFSMVIFSKEEKIK
jgi:hypothetical protein